jgi:nondiscriminating glutamyl-tRNA synthetase
MTDKKRAIKTRFAVSPTGFLHVGGLRAALFQYLAAKSNGGTILLRIEDTDQQRTVDGAAENLVHELTWSGMTFDEGVVLSRDGVMTEKGEHGPYTQSMRLDIYATHVKTLLGKDAAYYCFCTKERLDTLRQQQTKEKKAPGYDGHCRALDSSAASTMLQKQTPHVVRLKMPQQGTTTVQDVIRGEVSFQNSVIDDQVLIKADGFPTYHFAVVVDDYTMGVTHVIRGEEWLSSTPKHLVLYDYFGWDRPTYAHLPLLVNERKKKLSKRHGSVSVADFREAGYMPEALVNFIALLGWNPGDDREVFSLSELEKEFSLEHVSKSAAVFNREKLDWFNKQYLMKLPLKTIVDRALPYFVNAGIVPGDMAKDEDAYVFLSKAIALERSRVTTLSQLPNAVGFAFADELQFESELLVWKKNTREQSAQALERVSDVLSSIDAQKWNEGTLEDIVTHWIDASEFQIGDVLWPMRVALSGRKNSPGPFEIAALLGKERTGKRLTRAIRML